MKVTNQSVKVIFFSCSSPTH